MKIELPKVNKIKIGTCSWNYDSWVGLVYTKRCNRSAEYLTEYAKHFSTVEIDSWFYKPPTLSDANEYLERAGKNLMFSCKLHQGITLTHFRPKKTDATLRENPEFLSVDAYNHYTAPLQTMLPQIGAIELEFEYLNRSKMPSLDVFLKKMDDFFSKIDRTFPLAVETRNKNYLHAEYFSLLKEHNVAHVFTEKLYMPHIYEVYEKFGDLLSDTVLIRLLGGDRAEIEKKTGNKWDTIVYEKHDLHEIAKMAKHISAQGKKLFIYVNNHYEGSAVRTIERMRTLFSVSEGTI
ncbi:MAG: DUF72 domain-containing protein [Candidatus Latescibacteria bacterium]|nr:DUF72 domain-containing protein [Candidatus Latescibacterota bacterium]